MGRTWCMRCPVVQVGDKRVRFDIEIPTDGISSITGPVAYTVDTPSDETNVALISAQEGPCSGFMPTVSFTANGSAASGASRFAVTVAATVPGLSGASPVRIQMRTDHGAEKVRVWGTATQLASGFTFHI